MIDEALVSKETGAEETIHFHLCGYGHLDLSAHDNCFSDNMIDFALPAEEIARAMESVPQL